MLLKLVRPRVTRVLLCVVLIDALVTGTVYVVHPGHRQLREVNRLAVDYSGRAVAYAGLPDTFSSLQDADLVITASGGVRRVVDGHTVFDPDSSARYAIMALDRFKAEGQGVWVARAENALTDVLRHTKAGVLRHRQSYADRAAGLPTSWVSAKTQGLVLSALSRAYEITGRRQWSLAANDVFGSFLRVRDDPAESGRNSAVWFSFIDDLNYVWFEQYPQLSKPSQMMSGHIFAMFGLWDFLAVAPRRLRVAAMQLLEGGIATVSHYVPVIRKPFLAARVSPVLEERSLSEHQLITAQLSILEQVTGRKQFGRYAEDFRADSELAEFPVSGLAPRAHVDAYNDGSGSVAADTLAVGSPDASLGDALRTLEAYRRTGDRGLLHQAEVGIAGTVSSLKGGFVPHGTVARDAAGNLLTDPWYSARTQGLLLSALVRLAEASGEPRWAKAADSVFDSFRSFRDYPGNGPKPPRRWVSLARDNKGFSNLWFTESSHPLDHSRDVSRNVAAHLTALIGIYDYWTMTKDPVAERLFDGGATTIRSRFKDIRVPDEVAHTNLSADTSSLNDHRLITRQLATLSDMTGRSTFLKYAEQMREDAS